MDAVQKWVSGKHLWQGAASCETPLLGVGQAGLALDPWGLFRGDPTAPTVSCVLEVLLAC